MSYYVHPSSIINENCVIGDGTKIWHFSNVMSGAVIGNNCNLGQNVVVYKMWFWEIMSAFKIMLAYMKAVFAKTIYSSKRC